MKPLKESWRIYLIMAWLCVSIFALLMQRGEIEGLKQKLVVSETRADSLYSVLFGESQDSLLVRFVRKGVSNVDSVWTESAIERFMIYPHIVVYKVNGQSFTFRDTLNTLQP